jgi:hypothetical protein
MYAPSHEPPLPSPRGPLSEAVLGALGGMTPANLPDPVLPADPLADDDLQLALYCCYELHYASFAGVDPRWEWDPELLRFRSRLERAFESALGERVPGHRQVRPNEVGDLLFKLAREDSAPSLSTHLWKESGREQFEEFLIHRSAYQLKEADPHSFAIARISGPAKAAMLEVQFDEYGSGAPERMHSRLFAKAMDALGLDSRYGAYLDRLPGTTLATVNLITMFALHRRLRGSLVGHLAMFEITSPVPNRRYGAAVRRLGFGEDATDFFDEHVEADSVHEQVAAYDLAQRLCIDQPELTADVVFGAEALLALEADWARALLRSFNAGASSLLGVAALQEAVG